MGSSAGDGSHSPPCRCRWSWREAHLHRKGPASGIRSHGSQAESDLGHGHPPDSEAGGEKGKENPDLSSSTYIPGLLSLDPAPHSPCEREKASGEQGVREDSHPSCPSASGPLHTRVQGAPTRVRGAWRKRARFPTISAAGRRVPRRVLSEPARLGCCSGPGRAAALAAKRC